MKKESVIVEMTFTEPVLALTSGNKELVREFKTKKAPNAEAMAEEEAVVEDLEEAIEKASTVWPKDEGGLFLWNYQVKGFFKESISDLLELGDATVAGMSKWSYRRTVDNFLFVGPRRVRFVGADGKVIVEAQGQLERPIRVMTLQGPRIALARSEMIQPGAKIEFAVDWLVSANAKTKVAVWDRGLVEACLEVGSMRGFAQWRSGGWGRFTWKAV